MRIRFLAAVCAALVLSSAPLAALEQASSPGAQERTFLGRVRRLNEYGSQDYWQESNHLD